MIDKPGRYLFSATISNRTRESVSDNFLCKIGQS